MWKWTCPREPGIIWEHHTEEGAREHITGHVQGLELPSPSISIPPCPEEVHELVDDNEPCWMPNCKFDYIPGMAGLVLLVPRGSAGTRG